MIEIKKFKDDLGYYTFKIYINEGVFEIFFAGNLDLYWSYYGEDYFDIDKKSFTITKDHLDFYYLINTLYNKIINNLKYDNNNPHKLFQDNKVSWHSDDYMYEESAVLEIEKSSDSYIITFNKGRNDMENDTFAIRIHNSRSRYKPFNKFFMEMYNALIDYEEYHQITINEYLNELKRTRKKNDN